MGLGNIINSIPLFGHIKAGVHVLSGNPHEAAEAFNAANRSTAVVAGGAAGAVVGGPAGMIGGAIAAGTAVDGITSVANQRAEGVFEGLRDVGRDISNNKFPTKSLLKTGLYVGADALSGATGGNIAANIPKAVGKSLIKDAVTVVAKSTTQAMVATTAGGRATREIANKLECRNASAGSSGRGSSGSTRTNSSTSANNSTKTNSNSGKKSKNNETNSKSSISGGGGQPPQNNKNPNKTEHENDKTNADSHLQVFYRLFGDNITSLQDIKIAGVYIFREISDDKGRKNSLKKLITALRNNEILERVIEAVQNILKNFDPSEVNFQNFIYVSEMVSTYVLERLARRHEMQSSNQIRPRLEFHRRRAENLRVVLREILEPGSAHNILNIFESLRCHVKNAWRNCKPTFANIITAVTHYFKHKFVPASARLLNITEYFGLINSILPRVLSSTQYSEMVSGARRRLVYDVYRSEFKRRVRMVLQVQNGVIVLSSCHILDIIVDFNDKDGNEQFDPEY